jgi:hypothetical protein
VKVDRDLIGCAPAPPYVPRDRHSLRRKVALAYREAKIEGRGEYACFERAWAVFAAEEPERARDRSAGSNEVYRIICSAINADPKCSGHPFRSRTTAGNASATRQISRDPIRNRKARRNGRAT